MWGECLNFYYLADASKGWIHNEKGEYLIFLCFVADGVCCKISRVAAERSGQKRLEYIARIGMYSPEQLVFVDESSVDCRTTYRGHAWSIRGTKAQ